MALAVLTFALYAQVAWHDFIRLDDESYITQNLHVRAGLTWQTVRWSFTSMEQANWHPVTWISHALDCQYFGLNAGAHHLVGVLIHVLNAMLLFLFLRRVTGSWGCSFFVAALFAWHPFNVESVAWAAERKNVLSTLFFLLSLLAYSWYAQKTNVQRFATVAALFAVSLAAKPTLVTFPFLLLLIDFWPLQRVLQWTQPATIFPVRQLPIWRLLVEKVPLLALSAMSSAITMVAQRGAIASVENLPLTIRLANALYSYLMYVWKAVWPFGFGLYYPYPFDPTLSHPPGRAIYALAAIAALVLVSVSVMVLRQYRTHPYLAVGWFWYLGTLVPVIGIVQVGMQAMADRYAYVPLIGVFIMFAWGCADLADRMRIPQNRQRLLAALPLVALWILTFHQLGFWKNSYEIWAHTLEVTEDNFVADDNMAHELVALGSPESLTYFQQAASLAPKDGVSHGAIAAYLEDQGRLTEAIPEYQVVVENPPTRNFLGFAHANLGIIYQELDDPTKAAVEFQQALATDQQAINDMITDLTKKLAVHPIDEGYLRLGLLLEQAGRIPEARAACEHALTLKPGRPETLKCLSRLSASAR